MARHIRGNEWEICTSDTGTPPTEENAPPVIVNGEPVGFDPIGGWWLGDIIQPPVTSESEALNRGNAGEQSVEQSAEEPLSERQKCIKRNYGDSNEIAYELSPFSLLNFAGDKAMKEVTHEGELQARRDLNSGRYDEGKWQMKFVKFFKWLGRASGATGVGAGAYWLAGHAYCTFSD